MSRFVIILSLLCGFVLSGAGVATAETQTDDVDIDAIGEAVLESDPEDIISELETPPDDEILPEGFINPPSGTPENAEIAEALVLPVDDMEGAIGSLSHAFDTDPEVVPGLLSGGYINYIVAEEEITSDDLDDFEEGAAEGLESGGAPDTEGTVERIEVAGTDAVLISVVTEAEGITAVVQMVAIPVGNTMVIGTVLSADQGPVDPEEVLPFAEDLALSGISYLGEVAGA